MFALSGYADFDVSTNAWIYSDMHRGFRMLPWVGQWFGDESTITSDPLPVAYAQDGSAIVGCTKDGRVKLWSRLDGSEVQILAVDQARNQPLDALAVSRPKAELCVELTILFPVDCFRNRGVQFKSVMEAPTCSVRNHRTKWPIFIYVVLGKH
jgi:hypothetical protein